MRRIARALACLLVGTACTRVPNAADAAFVRAQYTKAEYQIPMRDGVKLYTIVYSPKDATDATR